MTREKALLYNDRLLKMVESEASILGIADELILTKINESVEFFTEISEKDFVLVGKNPASYKLGNCKVDMKKSLASGIAFLLEIGKKEEDLLSYVQLLIISIVFIKSLTKQTITKTEAYIVKYLNDKDYYEIGIPLDRLEIELNEEYKQKVMIDFSKDEFTKAINSLYKYGIIEINNEKVCLLEKVYGNI